MWISSKTNNFHMISIHATSRRYTQTSCRNTCKLVCGIYTFRIHCGSIALLFKFFWFSQRVRMRVRESLMIHCCCMLYVMRCDAIIIGTTCHPQVVVLRINKIIHFMLGINHIFFYAKVLFMCSEN